MSSVDGVPCSEVVLAHPRLALVVALLAAAGVSRAQSPEVVTILRDRWGVPHIFTEGRGAGERAAYANGYAQAEDRLFEMDILRRAATGRLAESLGPDYLLMDEVVRRDGYTERERDRFFARLAPRDRHALEAYRDGVNAFIAAHLVWGEFGSGVPWRRRPRALERARLHSPTDLT